MEDYKKRLEREINDFENAHPNIERIISEILRIHNLSNNEFDNDTERKHLMFKTISKFLR